MQETRILMSYKHLENQKKNIIDKILRGNQFYPAYFRRLSRSQKRRIQKLIDERIKFKDLTTNYPKIYVETSFHSAVDHLDNLLDQLKEDIFPLLNKTKGGAPFTVLRNIMCFCDYIARLQYGKKRISGDMDKLFDNFGPYDYIRTRYSEYKKYLIQLYRHDLVHALRPWSKVMFTKNAGKESLNWIGWNTTIKLGSKTEPYKKNFTKLKSLFTKEKNRKHLVHLRFDKISRSPRINLYCFLFDLVNHIEFLKDAIKNDKGKMEKFMGNLTEIIVENSLRLLKDDVPFLDLDNNKYIV